ncbi:hypothetical protein DSO57_1023324 [Entomophthora muscae]|uniref:Uncharacterized protein n=1 Tax=Entomophthora muscae TaxID=34485 RepID=A0ACC2TDQ3_9FUNG|nr:hypothetical protein DSO57_1023324 [Entomophthora muscae]
MLINTILGAAPELEPSLTSEDMGEEEAFDQDIQELQYSSHREEGSKNGRGDPREDFNDRSYYNQEEYALESLSSRTAMPKDSSPHFRQHSRMSASSSYSPTLQRSGREPNGRVSHQPSRLKYEEAENMFDAEEAASRDYEDSALSPYGAPLQDEQDQGPYYEDHSRPSSSSRHRSSHRGGDLPGYHPYPQSSRQPESRHRSNGNGHNRSSIKTELSVSPDGRYSTSYSHRSYRS